MLRTHEGRHETPSPLVSESKEGNITTSTQESERKIFPYAVAGEAEAHEERFRQHEALVEGLARILAAQHVTNQRQDGINERLTLTIERLDRPIERIDQTLAHVEITQARVETLLARLIRQGENGKEA